MAGLLTGTQTVPKLPAMERVLSGAEQAAPWEVQTVRLVMAKEVVLQSSKCRLQTQAEWLESNSRSSLRDPGGTMRR
jgi:hypothetical protein